MNGELQIALISGPAYDGLYEAISIFTAASGIKVTVGFNGDHPALNRHLSSLADIPYDLVSTHTKYAPSQIDFLAPLDELIAPEILEDFFPQTLELAKIDDRLYGIPRNIDVRLLYYRSDYLSTLPASWDELYETALQLNLPPNLYGFIFPGHESGLFGTFYELAETGGATLFPPDLIPNIENEGGRWALELLRNFYEKQSLPKSFTNWHYEEVHEIFRSGNAVMIGDFPGYYKYYQDAKISKVTGKFKISPYPAGTSGKARAYGGSHTFALTKKGFGNSDALALLKFFTDYEQQLTEAENGCVPVRKSVMRQIKKTANHTNFERLEMLEQVIEEQILIPPKVKFFPQIEDILWMTVQKAILGKISVEKALSLITTQIANVVEREFAGQSESKEKNISELI